jgi:hypothetical protein
MLIDLQAYPGLQANDVYGAAISLRAFALLNRQHQLGHHPTVGVVRTFLDFKSFTVVAAQLSVVCVHYNVRLAL